MKYLVLLVLLSFSAQAGELCIQSLNAYGVWNWKIDFFKTSYVKRAKLLNSKLYRDCDVIGLQEIWLPEFWQEIKFPFKTSWLSDEKKAIGTTILSKSKLKNITRKAFRLRAPGLSGAVRDLSFVNVGKGFTYGVMELDGAELHLFNVHFHPGFTLFAKATRLSHLLEVANFIVDNDLSHKAIIMTGDFNANTKSLELRFLEGVFGFKGRDNFEGECTFVGPGRILCQSIDFVLFKSGPKVFLDQKSTSIRDLSVDEFVTDHKEVTTWIKYTQVDHLGRALPLVNLEAHYVNMKTIFTRAGSRYHDDIVLLKAFKSKVQKLK